MDGHSWSWDELVADARSDPDVIGLVLTGGRGKGVHGPHSDWDALIVVSPAGASRWRSRRGELIDLSVLTPQEFAEHAEPDSETAWRGYDLLGLTSIVDRGGFQAALDRKGRLDSVLATKLAERSIDHALNQLYRATKNERDGNAQAAGLDLADLVAPWLTAVFALERRHRPYNKFLSWEMERRPLTLVPVRVHQLLADLDRVLGHRDVEVAWRLCSEMARGAVAAGVRTAVEGWANYLRGLEPAWPDQHDRSGRQGE